MSIAIKALAGALVVLLIAQLARSKHYYLAALIPLFPTFTLIAHAMVGAAHSNAELKQTILFSMVAILPFFAYLLSTYLLVDRMRFEFALGCSTLTWLVVAGALVMAWPKPY